MKTIAFIAVCSALLSGCQTKPIEAMSYSEQKQLMSQLLDRCHKQGVKPGTQEEKDCFYAETRSEAYKRQQNVYQRQALGQAMIVAGQPTMAPPPIMQPMGPQRVIIQPNTANALANHNQAFIRSRLR